MALSQIPDDAMYGDMYGNIFVRKDSEANDVDAWNNRKENWRINYNSDHGTEYSTQIIAAW